MKITLFLALTCILAGVFCDDDDPFSSKFDNLDVDSILKNDRLLLNYHKCLMSGTGCTPEGENLRKAVPKALEDGCERCTDKQREVAAKVIKFLIEKKPELWKELLEKFDPEKKFRSKYEDRLKEISA
ncbi:allergen Tha p 1-like [Coccinella septempunctata]|uniref:allergen Tha p 1-like n=1 Tax=Coccinella septempunctata TaxID=41139 RepID=UPI001D0652CF|nr:allergen Tha p 1-like [Coccinella septempunctata]